MKTRHYKALNRKYFNIFKTFELEYNRPGIYDYVP